MTGDPAQPPDIAAAVPGARQISYAAIRDASGVLGVWELPPGTRADDLARNLGAHDRLTEPRSYRQG